MKKTLQDQYLLIKEGKGHKGVFLADAKRDFPHIVPNHATFEEAAASLKTKNIISENVIGLSAIVGYEPKKKESYETAFEAFLAEARKAKENEDEKVKAEEKKVSKPVEKDLEKNFDYSDNKNPDNLIFDQIMMGYYAEMKDPKNADKTMQQLKDIVLKNLSKDPIHYTKDGQFGVKDLGYVTEHPGLGTPKEPKGKYASSGYGNLSENKGGEYGETTQDLKKQITEPSGKEKPSEEQIKAKLKQKREEELKRRKEAGESLEEISLRKAIQEMIDSELEEAYQLVNINPIKSDKEREERDPQPFKTVYLDPKTENHLKQDQHLRILRNPKNPEEITGAAFRLTMVGKEQQNNLSRYLNSIEIPENDRVNLINFLGDKMSDGGNPFKLPTKQGEMIDYKPLNYINITRNGGISFKFPNPKFQKPMEEILREGVEKDLADINKEAEHEILQSKLDKIDVLIDKRKSQLSKLDEDEDMKALTDKKKVKELEKDIKKLEQAKSKVEKMLSKTKDKKKEVIDETENDMVDENMPLDDDMMGEEMSYDENY